jgi:hypothetical protein
MIECFFVDIPQHAINFKIPLIMTASSIWPEPGRAPRTVLSGGGWLSILQGGNSRVDASTEVIRFNLKTPSLMHQQ